MSSLVTGAEYVRAIVERPADVASRRAFQQLALELAADGEIFDLRRPPVASETVRGTWVGNLSQRFLFLVFRRVTERSLRARSSNYWRARCP